jgi:hypothetical protein
VHVQQKRDEERERWREELGHQNTANYGSPVLLVFIAQDGIPLTVMQYIFLKKAVIPICLSPWG